MVYDVCQFQRRSKIWTRIQVKCHMSLIKTLYWISKDITSDLQLVARNQCVSRIIIGSEECLCVEVMIYAIKEVTFFFSSNS